MPEEINIREWVTRGCMVIRTSSLDYNDPDHPYNQAKSQGVRPEDFGISHPLFDMFVNWSRQALIEEIIRLRETIDGNKTRDY